MSSSAQRLNRRQAALCGCGKPALFSPRGGAVRARRDHTLCFRCWRAEESAERAHEMAAARARAFAFVPGPFALL
jgi:hypothetical protein